MTDNYSLADDLSSTGKMSPTASAGGGDTEMNWHTNMDMTPYGTKVVHKVKNASPYQDIL